ncbi:predicted protein [Histoplasma mississippiense (nom. inval.)]|uniref:predicted protein n=1 Tax=Ajellomyces capsulatus (strain NAm1 / WU24) TaxID=2059318 RepID=UPI000157D69B|nr:predicted protein [Histoplasma mississippiense (nom. inval.)]EDN09847.1 predicted protein [Histoplasma mississippiense (nom. inval.)]
MSASTRWKSNTLDPNPWDGRNPSKERINPICPNPLDEPIIPLDEPINPLDPTRWTSNPLDVKPVPGAH